MSIVLTSSKATGEKQKASTGLRSSHFLSRYTIGSAFLLALLYLSLQSLSFAQQQSIDGGTRRTAAYMDWATSTNSAGKLMAVKRKGDKVNFKISLSVASNSNVLLLEFGMNAIGAITRGSAKTDTLATFNGKKMTTTLSTVNSGDSIQIDGIGYMGKKMTLKYKWGTGKPVTVKDPLMYKLNKVGLPMPNLINVGEELFPKGFGQTTPYFANGLVIGVPQGLKSANSVRMKKYSDVLASLVSKTTYHTGNVRCFDSLGKKLFTKQINTFPPKLYNNKLFAEALALKLNIAASATQKFPVGLGEEEYSNSGSPFHHLLVSQISAVADTMISCLTPTSIGAATLTELYDLLHLINTAYANTPYTIDTLSFGTKTQLTSLYLADKVSELRPRAGLKPVVFNDGENLSNTTPSAFALHQNFPNPFNPTTNLSFELSSPGTVTIKIFNMLGQEVTTLINNEQYEGGVYDVAFDASNLTSGIYFYRLHVQTVNENGIAQNFTDVKRMTLIK